MTRPRLHDGIQLVSTRSAIPCARLFVEHILGKWGAYTLIREAVRQVHDLVTMAVGATGITEDRSVWGKLPRIEFITVRLLGFEESVRIEVWDSGPNLPVLDETVGSDIRHTRGDSGADDDDCAEQGAVRRGAYPTPRGRVVWVEVSVYPHRPSLPPQPPAERFRRDHEALRRVRDGLEDL